MSANKREQADRAVHYSSRGAAADDKQQPSPTANRRRRGKRIRWSVRILVLLLLISYLKFVGLDGKFYYPNQTLYDSPADFGLSAEEVSFQTDDGLTLAGWFLPAIGTAKGTVVHFHGNAANITAHIGLVEWLPRAGYHVLMFDYRGYGQSQGKVTRAGTIRDGHAALDYALTRPEAASLPLFAYGQSLGGAVAIVVAAQRLEVRAVVAESPFSSYRGVAARHASRLVFFEWLGTLLATLTISAGEDPIDVVGRLAPRPLFVIAAEHDEICFPELARELYEAAAEPKDYWLVPDAAHLGIVLEARRELIERVTDFFARAATP